MAEGPKLAIYSAGWTEVFESIKMSSLAIPMFFLLLWTEGKLAASIAFLSHENKVSKHYGELPNCPG